MVGDLVGGGSMAALTTAQLELIETVLVACQLGVEPVAACKAAGVSIMQFWHAVLLHDTYIGTIGDRLTKAQRHALILEILRAPKED